MTRFLTYAFPAVLWFALTVQAHAVAIGQTVTKTDAAVNTTYPIVQTSDSTVVNRTLDLTAGTKTVHTGFNFRGGGYWNSLVLEGYGALDGVNLMLPYYGRGAQASFRDNAHDGAYNPTQAGVAKNAGAKTKVADDTPGRLYVRQYNVPLFLGTSFDFTQCEDLVADTFTGDGGNTDSDLLTESCPGQDGEMRSEWDGVFTYIDRSALFGIPALQIDGVWAYLRSPGAIQQFTNPSAVDVDGNPVLRSDREILDMSKGTSGNQTAGPNDMSVMINAWDLRLTPDFDHVMYHAADGWHAIDVTGSFTQKLNCRIEPDDTYYTYTGGGSPRIPLDDCGADNDLVMLTVGSDPDTSLAVAIYEPQSGADSDLNVNQSYVIGPNSHVTSKEDRGIQRYVRETHMNSSEGDFQKLNVFTNIAGVRSPDTLGTGGYEAVSSRRFVLFGTPNEILSAVQDWKTAGHTGDEP